MEIKTTIGERIKDLIEKSGKEQYEVAKDLGISTGTLSTIVNDRMSEFNLIKYIDALASYFDVSPDYLLGETEAQTTNRDLQFVCDYTGLSEFIVTELSKLKGAKLDFMDFLISEFCRDELSLFDDFVRLGVEDEIGREFCQNDIDGLIEMAEKTFKLFTILNNAENELNEISGDSDKEEDAAELRTGIAEIYQEYSQSVFMLDGIKHYLSHKFNMFLEAFIKNTLKERLKDYE